MKLNVFVVSLLLALCSPVLVKADDSDDKKDRIVIQTPLQNYEQPSLRDYEECHANRESCIKICAGKSDCESECPLCPELTDEPLLVQGVNDTLYVPPASPVINTTNIIRLTNEINNVIQNDIQARNEINVKVHQNVSQVGGRFGLGYNEQGSCCYVVRRDRNCDETKEQCPEHSRQRVCGQRCQARVMIAKLIVVCKPTDEAEDCQESVEYVPARRHRSKHRKQQQSEPCRYMNSWPYVACGGQDREGRRHRRASCQKCEQLTYGFILQNGLPAECAGCFPGYAAPLMPAPMFYAPYAPLPNYGFNYRPRPENQQHDKDIDSEDDDSGWVLDTEKCTDDDGQLVDCPKKEGDGADTAKPSPPAHLEQGNNNNNNNNKNDNDNSLDYDYGSGYDVPAQRRRRHRRHHSNPGKFVRSIYSRRSD